MNGIQLLVMALAFLLLMLPLLLLSYIAGRNSHRPKTLPQFDRLPFEDVQVTGSWRTEFDREEPDENQIIHFDLKQHGCRIVATSRGQDGASYFLEGILFDRRLYAICIEEIRHETTLGTIAAELLPDHSTMVGMRTHWSQEAKALILRKVSLVRTA